MCAIGAGRVSPGQIEDALADELLIALRLSEVHVQQVLGSAEAEPAVAYRRDEPRVTYTVLRLPLAPAVDSVLSGGLPYVGSAAMLAPEVGARIPGRCAAAVLPLRVEGHVRELVTLVGESSAFAPDELELADVLIGLASVLLAAAEARAGARDDPLTGALTAEAVHERLEEEVQRAKRHRGAVSCVVLGIDGLAAINARHGEQFRDVLLRHLARVYLGEVRCSDRVGRVADDEFAIVLPGAGGPRAEVVARRAVARLREIKVESMGDEEGLTASVGVAAWEEPESAASMLERAVQAMHEVRRAGGDAIAHGVPRRSGILHGRS
jgi:diguanylate cyclase (GGDEF)-like protein